MPTTTLPRKKAAAAKAKPPKTRTATKVAKPKPPTMSAVAKRLLSEALALPMKDRRMIADHINFLDELEDDESVLDFEDPYNDPEFAKEIDRRLEESRNHPERLIDGAVIFAKLQKSIDRLNAVRK